MNKTKVYIDTNIYKFSATDLLRLRPRKQILNWGGAAHEDTVYDFVHINPNSRISDYKLKQETDLLPKLAELGKEGRLNFVLNIESIIEICGIPNMDSQTGSFYGAPCEKVEAPVKYSRILFGFKSDSQEDQFNFLANIRNKRFLELQKLTGAYQGKNSLSRNQLLDAFYLWCAEHNRCEYFLTLDFKLIKAVIKNTRINYPVKLVKPSVLLCELEAKA